MSTTWPLWLRRLLDETTIHFARCYELARQRAAGSASSVKRMMAERDDALLDANLLKREIAVLRRNRASLPHEKRPHYSPQDRREILQIRRLRRWSLRMTAHHFVLHYNTIWNWNRAWLSRTYVGLFFGRVPWNRLSDGVRWAVHELRELCVEIEFGTRSIAMHLVRNGVQIHRSTVQRVLREEKPSRPPVPEPAVAETVQGPDPVSPHSILRPTHVRRTYHMDFTTFDFLFVRFYVAVVVDGFSRRLLALKVFPDSPTTAMVLSLLRKTFAECGPCRFLYRSRVSVSKTLQGRDQGSLRRHARQGPCAFVLYERKSGEIFQNAEILATAETSVHFRALNPKEARCVLAILQLRPPDVRSRDADAGGNVERRTTRCAGAYRGNRSDQARDMRHKGFVRRRPAASGVQN